MALPKGGVNYLITLPNNINKQTGKVPRPQEHREYFTYNRTMSIPLRVAQLLD